MKKLLCTVLSTVLAISSAAALNMSAYADSANTQQVSYNYWYNSSTGYTDENVHTRQMEKLDRGLIAIKTDGGVYLSWRLLTVRTTFSAVPIKMCHLMYIVTAKK